MRVTSWRWAFSLLAISLLLTTTSACSKGLQLTPTPSPSSAPPASPEGGVLTTVPATPAALLSIATSTPVPATPTAVPATAPIPGMAITDVQFALDVDQTGQLVYPATEFVFGVTRVYVRFAYQGLEDAAEVESTWYLNRNPVVSGTLAWDGGGAGSYVIWMEDPNGIGRGQWLWELAVGDIPLGSGTFTIGGESRYVNAAWGLAFDPPATWRLESEEEGFVTFSSPDRRQALALRLALATAGLTETVAADLELFQETQPEAQVVATQDVTMGGARAVLQQVHYTDQERGDQLLYVVSSLHAGSAYSLWVLGPTEDAQPLQALLIATLRSIRFVSDE